MPSWSLALGLMYASASATQAQRTQDRIDLAIRAADAGYALVETYETSGHGIQEDLAFEALEMMATRLRTRALVYSGDVDLQRVNEVAKRIRLLVLEV
jgi:hypothetical protein